MKKITLCLLAALILVAQPLLAADKEKLARELLVQSGLKDTIESIPADIQSGFSQQGQEMAALAQVIGKAFDVSEMQRMTEKRLASELKEKDFRYALKWLESSLGKKITGLEVNENGLTEEKLEKLMKEPLDKLVTDKRMAQLRELDAATRYSESAIDLILYMQVAMIMGVSQVNPEMGKLELDQVVNMLEQKRGEFEAAMMPYLTVSFIHTYKGLSDGELQKYVDFASSTTGKRYHEALLLSFNEAFLAQSRDAGEALGRFLMELQKAQTG